MLRPAPTGAWLLVLAGCHSAPVPSPVVEPLPLSVPSPEPPDAWRVFLRPHVRSVAQIDADVWGDGEVSVFLTQMRSFRDDNGVRTSVDFPVAAFTDAAGGEGGMLWATASMGVYRTPSPDAVLEPVEGIRARNVAAAGNWGAVCSEGTLYRVPLAGPLKPESMGRGCEKVESTGRRIFVKDADGWSATHDLRVFTSDTPPQTRPRPGRRKFWPTLGPVARVGDAWRTADGQLMDESGPLDVDAGVPRDTPHAYGCRRFVGLSGIRALCSARGEDDALYRWSGGWSKLHARAGGAAQWLRGTSSRFSDVAAFTGPCDASETLDAHELAVCVLEPGAQPRTHRWVPEFCEDDWDCDGGKARSPEGVLDLSAFEASVIVYRVSPLGGDDRLLDLRENPSDPLPSCEDARLVGPWHLECKSSARGLEVFSLAGDSIATISLPEGAHWVGFASADRGMAAGLNAAALWTTIDAGASWQPLDVEFSGNPDSLPLAAVRCTNVACGAGPVVWVDGEVAAALGVESVHYVGFEHTPLEAHPATAPW